MGKVPWWLGPERGVDHAVDVGADLELVRVQDVPRPGVGHGDRLVERLDQLRAQLRLGLVL